MTTPRALRLLGPGKLALVPAPVRSPGPGEVRLRAVVSGVSHGTELHLVRGSSPFADRDLDPDLRRFLPTPPAGADAGTDADGGGPLPGAALGYELVGEVVEAGPGVDLAPGTLVHAPVPHAEQACVALGPELDIGYPAQVLPDGLDPEAAACLSLAAVALFAVHDARIDLGDEVAVFGLGAIGLLVVQLVRASGAGRVVGIDPLADRRALAVELGAHEVLDPAEPPGPATSIKQRGPGRGVAAGVDVVIETSGAPAALHEAIAAVRVAGTVVSAGFVQGGAGALRLGEEWHHNRPQLISSMGVWGCPHRAHPRWDRRRIAATALGLLAEGRLAIDPLIGERVPFEQAPQAYARLADDPGAPAKVLLTY